PAEEADVPAAFPSVPEPGADEQPTGNRRRRTRRTRDTETTDEAQPTASATDESETTADADGTSGTRSRRSRSNRTANRQAAQTDATDEGRQTVDGTDGSAATDADGTAGTRSRRSRSRSAGQPDVTTPGAAAPDASVTDADTDVDAEASDVQGEDGEEGGEGTRRRRRRRGGRRRRKTGDVDGADDSTDDQSDDEQDEDAEAHADDADQDGTSDADDDEAAGGSSRRRRRRRRRKGEESTGAADDPDETVVRVREPRSKNTANEITAVEGSTRLEAKKQRRREGRAAGRRRAPIVTEAEFLARRESVERTMVIRSREDLTQIAVSEDNVLVEHYVTTAEQTSLIGNVYLGRVQNVLPSMEAAFIDIGKGRNAVLYAGEVDWATLGGANGPRKIEQVLKSGQSVLVQVTKDPIGHKGARLTNQISLPGRYVVYVPRGGNGGISRKLPDTERNRLKTILKDIVPDEAGVIVRTAAEGASEEELTSDVSRLQAAWEDIDKKSKNGQAPQLLYGEPDLLIRVVRDLFTEDFAKLVISGDHAYDQVREYVEGVAPHLADRVEKWSGDGDVFGNYRIDEQIKKALDRKVWLPSGGSLIIDRTEAMTVVDVNTGKFTGSGGNLEETVTKNNLEAAEEIVRQLRLRDIGGIIVIDFIDMVLESNRDLVLRRLVECLGRDRTKHQVAEVTSLGLVQMTRKRIGTGLLEAFSENCDHCGGRGLILHDEPKESRRNGRNGQQGGNGQQNGHDHAKPAAQADESGRKSSRRRRGRGRGDDEQAHEPEAQHHNGDAAQKLAQIAAATVKKDEETGTPEPTGYPVSAATEDHVSPEATGFPAPPAEAAAETVAEVPADATTEAAADGSGEADAADAAQNGAPKSTRRRRSSRRRSKTATEGDTSEPSELVTTGS
ncbi:MAG: ribonuclease E/G, partial [Kribbellaceae bacterium]|nr:ribonuclease E/G [Kribbellaceae bacterium]